MEDHDRSGSQEIKSVPELLRSDNGPEFVARDLRKWLAAAGAKTLYIEPGSPWELSLLFKSLDGGIHCD
jgi:transposase InsO family protein